MPKLFNHNLIKTHIQKHNIYLYDEKVKVIQGWKKSLQTVKGVNEKSLQSAFLQGIFGKVLGYKCFGETDEWNLNIEVSTEVDATTPDGILGFYTAEDSSTQVVIELKSPKVSLDKKQHRAGKDYGTPVEQAFSYVSKYDHCSWVIVSNMNEIRIYKLGRSQEYYESFFIDDLDQEDEFKKFHLLLCKENFIQKDGDSETYKLNERTKERIQDISVSFYNLYKDVRIKLFEELKLSNPDYSHALLVEKAQKFLDRIIFICFCEDLGLLPNDLLHQAIQRGKNSFSDSEYLIWEEIKGVFRAIDKGSEKHNITAYDGGLFAFDEVLDNLAIRNDFFEAVYDISAYDFGTDLDVNILGHIFEQSIADIEELKSDVQKEEYDPQKSRRKKEGIYYTPNYITKYIVENSLGKYLEDIRKELGEDDLPDLESATNVQTEGRYRKRILKFYQYYEERVKQVKVLDPACGSGAFLNQAFDFLLDEYKEIHKRISDLVEGQTTIFDSDTYQREVLQDNLYGVDINEESVEITKLSLWLKTADSRKALPYLDDNIKCGNSLINDPEVAGDKAFDWNIEFPEIMERGGFDVVIGNPPYVRQEQLHDFKDYLSIKYNAYNNSADIYCYFIEKGITLVKENGYFSYIVSSKFTRTKYGEPLRSFLLYYQVEEYRGFDSEKVFAGVTVDPCILTVKKKTPHSDHLVKYNMTEVVPQKQLNPEIWSFITIEQWELMKKLEAKGLPLKSWDINITRGVLTGLHDVFVIDETKKQELLEQDPANEEIIKPILRGRDIKRYEYNFNNKYLLATGYDIDIPNKYSTIYSYLCQFKDKAVKRYDKGKNWWNLRKFDYYNEFEKEMIVWIELTDKPNFTIVKSFYIAQTLFFMTGNDLHCLLPILNSKLIYWYFNNISTSSGVGTNRWIKYKIEQIPIPTSPQFEKVNIENNAKDMLSLKEKLKYNSQKTFAELARNFLSEQNNSFKDIIVESSDFYNPTTNLKTNKFSGFALTVNNEIVTIFVGTTSEQKKEILKFEVKDHYKRQYLKLFLENLTKEQLAEINQYEGNILDKVMQIQIPDYD